MPSPGSFHNKQKDPSQRRARGRTADRRCQARCGREIHNYGYSRRFTERRSAKGSGIQRSEGARLGLPDRASRGDHLSGGRWRAEHVRQPGGPRISHQASAFSDKMQALPSASRCWSTNQAESSYAQGLYRRAVEHDISGCAGHLPRNAARLHHRRRKACPRTSSCAVRRRSTWKCSGTSRCCCTSSSGISVCCDCCRIHARVRIWASSGCLTTGVGSLQSRFRRNSSTSPASHS